MSAGAASWDALPLGGDVRVLGFDANGLGALEKPAGTLSHPNERHEQERALLTCPYDLEGECYMWTDAAGSARKLWLLNRLDSATSGVVLVANEAKLAAELKAQFERKSVEKTYVALVFGIPVVPREIWRDRLTKERKGGMVRATAHGHVPAESECRVLKSSRGSTSLALIELKPRTGRTHQLRVQCANRRLPIVGDQTYGDFRKNREFAPKVGSKRLFLHALATRARYAWAGRNWEFAVQAPLPAEFQTAIR